MRAVLGIDAASRQGSVALAIEGAAVEHAILEAGGHSSRLSDAASSLLAARSLEWRALHGVAVAEGPGSFTGLRVGLAWAKGLVTGLDIALALVPSHEAHARAARGRGDALVTVLPGERGHLQAAFWEGSGEEGAPEAALLWGPVSIPQEDLVETLLDRVEGRPGTLPRVVAPELPAPLAGALSARGFEILPPGPLAGAVAELGDRMIREGRTADRVAAAPAYGRAANARRPAR